MKRQVNTGEIAAYSVTEAARYLKIPPATLRSWVIGREYPRADGTAYFERLILPADGDNTLLSFNNLIEAHVLRALRQKHGVSIKDVRSALQVAQDRFGIGRLLLSRELTTAAGQLFTEKYGELINLSKSGQVALRVLFEDHLRRIEWNAHELPGRLYPFTHGGNDKVIAIDPAIAFGRPILSGKSISTAIIADRVDAGESVDDLAKDYDLDEHDVEAAILYEQAA